MKSIQTIVLSTLISIIVGTAAHAASLDFYSIEFTSGATVHQALLWLKNDAGEMRVRFYDDSTSSTQMVEMTMTLKSTKNGLFIESGRAIDVATGLASGNYTPDNFLIRREPDGKVNIYNIDDKGKVLKANMTLVTDSSDLPDLLKKFQWRLTNN